MEQHKYDLEIENDNNILVFTFNKHLFVLQVGVKDNCRSLVVILFIFYLTPVCLQNIVTALIFNWYALSTQNTRTD